MKHKIFLIILILIITAILLLWTFAVPHYKCGDCNFNFWGDYYDKNLCIQNCFKFPYSSSNRFFCAKIVNELDKNEYKICTPCVNNPLYKNPVKYIVNNDSSISIEECNSTNSYSNYQDCVNCNPINKGQTYPKNAKWKRQYPDYDPDKLPSYCKNIKDKNSCWLSGPLNSKIKNYINYMPIYYSGNDTPYWIKCDSNKSCCDTCKMKNLFTS